MGWGRTAFGLRWGLDRAAGLRADTLDEVRVTPEQMRTGELNRIIVPGVQAFSADEGAALDRLISGLVDVGRLPLGSVVTCVEWESEDVASVEFWRWPA